RLASIGRQISGAFEDCFARLSLPASSIRTWPELRAQLKHMGKVSRGWWFGGFRLCSFLSPKMVRSAPRRPSIPALAADRHGGLSLPVRSRFPLLSRFAACAGLVIFRLSKSHRAAALRVHEIVRYFNAAERYWR